MLELVHIIWTVLLLIIFVAIVVWAWSKPQQQRFERAAWAPLLDENVRENKSALRATINKVQDHG